MRVKVKTYSFFQGLEMDGSPVNGYFRPYEEMILNTDLVETTRKVKTHYKKYSRVEKTKTFLWFFEYVVFNWKSNKLPVEYYEHFLSSRQVILTKKPLEFFIEEQRKEVNG